MARKRYTEEQIIAVLSEAEAGAKTGELCRRARDERRHLLQVESQVRWADVERVEEAEVP